jgi:hypothetical protein
VGEIEEFVVNIQKAYLYSKEIPMDLVSKYDLIEKIVNTDNEVLLQQVKILLEGDGVESWDDLDPNLRASLEEGIAQSDRGEVIPHEEVMKEIRKKYPK